jgi:protein involved in polysaccharide export with SLBB domain
MIVLKFSNESGAPRVIYVEPAGGDYTLMPGEELEIQVEEELPKTFCMVESANYTQVFLENVTLKNLMTVYTVNQNGREIEAGHNNEHNPHISNP